MEPSRNARAGAAAGPARTLLLAGLAALTLLALASPASAIMTEARFAYMVDGVGVGVGVHPEDSRAPVFLQMCIQHDSWWDEIPKVGPDGGDTAVWVPIPPDSSMGSEKASTSCLDVPGGSAPPIPVEGQLS